MLDGLAGLDGVRVLVIDAGIGNLQLVQQRIAALLLFQPLRDIARAALIPYRIDIHMDQPLRM